MAELREIKKNEVLFREGDIPDNMYIVKSGKLEIIKLVNSKEVSLLQAIEGQLIGEMALFDLKPRSASVRAIEDSVLIVLPYVNLFEQMDKLPSWVNILMRTLAENLRVTNDRLTSGASNSGSGN